VPAAHLLHDVLLFGDIFELAGHDRQVFSVPSIRYEPAGQSTQLAPLLSPPVFVIIMPAMHDWHNIPAPWPVVTRITAPVSAVQFDVSGTHDISAGSPSVALSSYLKLKSAYLNRIIAAKWQNVLPIAAKCPAVHGMQLFLVPPTLYVSSGHCEQVAVGVTRAS